MGKSEAQIQALRAGRFPSQKNAGKLQWEKMLQAVMAVPTEGGRLVEVGVGIGWQQRGSAGTWAPGMW